MVDDAEQNNGLPLPSTLNLRKQGDQPTTPTPIPASNLRPKTIKLKPARPVLPKPIMTRPVISTPATHKPMQPISVGARIEKKETSRIPLDATTGSPATIPGAIIPSAAPKTIRIAPKAITPQTSPATIKLKPKSAVHGVAVSNTGDKKKETSRIPLDAALTPSTNNATGSGPRTIRLKRPGASAQLKTSPNKPKANAEKIGLGATTRMEDTARIEAQDQPTPTRRKTIRVKRPGQSLNSPSISRQQPMAQQANVAPQEMMVVEDQPCWVFPFCAVLAIFVVIATIYVFTSQAIGPNPSLSQLSWYIEGPDLGMPMKIAPPRR